VQMTMAWADIKPDGDAASPQLFTADDANSVPISIREWEEEAAPKYRAALQKHVYGMMPDGRDVEIVSETILDEAAFNGAGVLSEYALRATARFGGESAKTNLFYMNVVTPSGKPDAPIILMQTFCPRWNTIPHAAITRPEGGGDCGGGSPAAPIGVCVFGRYIATPPIEEILQRGYAIATIFPSEFVPDNAEAGLAALAALNPAGKEDAHRWGAVAAWAWGFSVMVDALERADQPPAQYIAYGHSRYGKSALVAGAFDRRINAVSAHQSGTGGAALNRNKRGESVGSITKSYPHWFAPAYSDYAGREEALPVDQHHLLALMAPRPILLGNARRDVWSDPKGSFRAAMGADPAYALYGLSGLDQDRLDVWRPDADIAFWLRPGTHGGVKEDWPAFLAFLDAHFFSSTN